MTLAIVGLIGYLSWDRDQSDRGTLVSSAGVYTAIPAIVEYAHQHGGLYPPVDFSETGLEFGATKDDIDLSYQQLNAIRTDYYYLGYAITNVGELEAYEDACAKLLAQGLQPTEDLDTPAGEGNFGSSKLYRLRIDLGDKIADDLGMNRDDVTAGLRGAVFLMEAPRDDPRTTYTGLKLSPSLTVARWTRDTFPYTADALAVIERLHNAGGSR